MSVPNLVPAGHGRPTILLRHCGVGQLSVGVPLRQLRGHVEIHRRKLATDFLACLFIMVLFLAISVHGCFYILSSFSGLVLKPFSLSVLVALFFTAILRAHSSQVILFEAFQFVSSSAELFFTVMLFFQSSTS